MPLREVPAWHVHLLVWVLWCLEQMQAALEMLLQSLNNGSPTEQVEDESWEALSPTSAGRARTAAPPMPKTSPPTPTTVTPATPIRARWSQRCQACLDGIVPGMMVLKRQCGWCHANCSDPTAGFVEPKTSSRSRGAAAAAAQPSTSSASSAPTTTPTGTTGNNVTVDTAAPTYVIEEESDGSADSTNTVDLYAMMATLDPKDPNVQDLREDLPAAAAEQASEAQGRTDDSHQRAEGHAEAQEAVSSPASSILALLGDIGRTILKNGTRKFLEGNASRQEKEWAESWRGLQLPTQGDQDVQDIGVDVSEFFCRGRFAEQAERMGMTSGEAYDIVKGMAFDLAKKDVQRKAYLGIDSQRPWLTVLCPPCRPHGGWNYLNEAKATKDSPKKPEDYLRDHLAGSRHLRFCRTVAEKQSKVGRKWLFEAPWSNEEWDHPDVQAMGRLPGAVRVRGDQCRWGLKDPVTKQGIQKATGWLTNDPYLAKALARLCECPQPHVICGGTTTMQGEKVNRSYIAQFYPEKLIRTILTAASRTRQWQEEGRPACPADAERDGGDRPEEVAVQHRWDEALWSVGVSNEDSETKKLRRTIYKCHCNLGHPSMECFLHTLRAGGAAEG